MCGILVYTIDRPVAMCGILVYAIDRPVAMCGVRSIPMFIVAL